MPEAAIADLNPAPETVPGRILTAARACFARSGVRKTSIEDIAAEARLSRPTIYKHFGGKEAIVSRLSLIEMETLAEVIRARRKPRATFPERLTEALLVSVQVAHENTYVRLFLEDITFSSRAATPAGPAYAVQRERWRSLLTGASADGELADDLTMDEIVNWLSLCQFMVLVKIDAIAFDEESLRTFIRRFVVEPLLAARGQPHS